jgi:MFS family permease
MTSTGARSGNAVRPMLVVWLAWTALMASANLASPLYAEYADRFSFSSLVLTLVFSTYAAVLVVALMLFGRLADRFGRKPVLLGGLTAGAIGVVLFALAYSTAWLFAARVFQGLAVGMVSGPATAVLVELEPHDGSQRPALLAGLAQVGGSAAGPIVAAVLAEWAPWPLHLCYWVSLATLVAAAAAVLALPEPGERAREPWRIRMPRLPDERRTDFARVALTSALVWGSLAMFLSVVPKYAGELLDSHNLALVGVVAAFAVVASGPAHVLAERLPMDLRAGQAGGLVALAVGLAALTVAAPEHSLALLVVAALTAGGGHGVAFVNAQHELNGIAPPDRRAEVTAAFICCIYAVVGGATVGSGLLALDLPFTLAVGIVTSMLAAAALVTAGWAARAAS